MTDSGPARVLARCTGDPDRFAHEVWGRRTQVHQSGTPATDLLSLTDVDRLVTSSALRLPAFRLVKDGSPLPPSSYTTNETIGGRPYNGVAEPTRVLAAMDDGATLVLQGMQRYHPPLAAFCRDLELALGHRCQVNAYVTPPGARGLDVHRDPHDVFVLQAFGSKQWEVHPTPWQERREPGTQVAEQTLSPGDVQYLPKGTPHAAHTQRELSGHVTVGVLATTWSEALTGAVRDVLADEPEASESLPVGWQDDQPAVAGMLADRLTELAKALRDAPAEELVRKRAEAFLTHRPSLLAGALLDRQRLAELDDETRLVRRSGAPLAVAADADNERVRVLLGDRELRVPAWIRPALETIADRTELRPVDLAGDLDVESRVVLCSRLVREGLLTVAGRS
ncbi:MAG: cupin domain-containing protein [Streptosporangiales bacterium]